MQAEQAARLGRLCRLSKLPSWAGWQAEHAEQAEQAARLASWDFFGDLNLDEFLMFFWGSFGVCFLRYFWASFGVRFRTKISFVFHGHLGCFLEAILGSFWEPTS